jgi:O-antigen ligase
VTARPADGYRPAELLAAGTGFVLPVLFVTAFTLSAWGPRDAALPVVAAGGLSVVARVLTGPLRRPALLATSFLVWALVATAAAPNPTVAFWGRYSLGTGWVFVAALVGAWTLGAAARPGAASLIERAILAACLVNAAVAFLQQLFNLSALQLGLYQGRSPGLFGNPVYLAELLAGGLWLTLCRFGRVRWAWAGIVFVAGAVALTGSRFGLGLAVLAAAAAIRRLGWRPGLVAAGLVAVGLALGTAVGAAGPGGAGATSVDRAGQAPVSGVRPRLDTWASAVPAVGQRPLVGWGPSGFLAATTPRRTLAVAREEGADQIFGDAHNLLVEYAVTTGIPGLGLLVAWLVTAFAATRRRDGWPPLAGFAAFTLALSLVEPLYVGVTPIAVLALGAAAASVAVESKARTNKTLMGVLAMVGVVTAAVLATGLILLQHANVADDPAGAKTAVRLLPAWPQPATQVAHLEAVAGATGHAGAASQALAWFATAAHRDPADPGPWNEWGGALLVAGDAEPARAAFEHALARNPWSLLALRGLAHIAVDQGDPAAAMRYRARIQRLTG